MSSLAPTPDFALAVRPRNRDGAKAPFGAPRKVARKTRGFVPTPKPTENRGVSLWVSAWPRARGFSARREALEHAAPLGVRVAFAGHRAGLAGKGLDAPIHRNRVERLAGSCAGRAEGQLQRHHGGAAVADGSAAGAGLLALTGGA